MTLSNFDKIDSENIYNIVCMIIDRESFLYFVTFATDTWIHKIHFDIHWSRFKYTSCHRVVSIPRTGKKYPSYKSAIIGVSFCNRLWV